MKILRSWLAEFVDLSTVPGDEMLAAVFSRAGIEVASRETSGADTVFEIEVTANRPDLLSHRGVAREIAALAEMSARDVSVGDDLPSGGTFPIRISSGRCARYSGVVLRRVRVADSPARVSDRLRAMGLHPISNVVDATNYALFELNHPLHAFDLDKLDGEIEVRAARDGEIIRLLDGTERMLTAEDLVIADRSRAVALAGVMGGSDTAVSASTTNLLLEAAWFDPASVRRTARRLGISTDSSYRFERGADLEGTIPALRLLVALITASAGAAVDGGVVDVRRREPRARMITIRAERIRSILGCAVPNWPERLKAIGVRVNESQNLARLPSWRVDLEREIDLIEELARLDGYDKIESELPPRAGHTPDFHPAFTDATAYARMKTRLADVLAAQGFDRCVNFSFEAPPCGDLEVMNPINAEENCMRGTLLASLLRTAKLRSDRAGLASSALFEIDKVFRKGSGGPEEREAVAFLLCGAAEERRYDGRAADMAAIDHALGVVRALGAAFHVEVAFSSSGGGALFADRFHAAVFADSARVGWGGRACGRIGLFRDNTLGAVYGCELDLYELFAATNINAPAPYRPLPRYPAATRDLAFWLDGVHAVGDVVEAARSAGAQHLESCALFDIFAKKSSGAEPPRKSVAIRLVFRSPDRTLTDDEVSGAAEKIAARIRETCGGELRAS